ncbi:unnamed protein product [Brassicogethes aeneus]|uniref:2-phosphoxylose phosphatase 1 n=1 Tax=Brassicogethes aeneus TaxID=1431903 RepID=A0A9P0BL53_BRAAE|nr:unnamed protein product [Brassicogethes aeneus]
MKISRMSFDVLKLPAQNKALHCYLLMSVWILLLIVGVYYKFLEPSRRLPEPASTTELFQSLTLDVKTKRIFKICNFPDEMGEGDEGSLRSNKWLLKGVMILIRHGDRGPLQHVKKISSINCGTEESDILNSYKTYLHNLTVFGKLSWVGPGPFHGFPILPAHTRHCNLGQLTMKGVSQLLKLGSLLKRNYKYVWPKLEKLNDTEILVYSTRYRRTFQSALAFLYGFIPKDSLSKLGIYESQSMSFCFKDCGCPVTDKLAKFVRDSISYQLKAHPAVALLTQQTGKALFSSGAEQGSLAGDPHAVRDALLTYVCHGSGLPCENSNNCVRRQNVAGVFAYTDWVNHQKWRNTFWKRMCLLKSYGLMRHLVQQMLHVVSDNGPYFTLYSGHDHTVEQLTTALGISNDPLLLRYAARVAFEVYQDNREPMSGAKAIYFRVLANGKDVTRQVAFCKNIATIGKVNLCKIEDIVRFLHDDYFTGVNATNYKDACAYKYD